VLFLQALIAAIDSGFRIGVQVDFRFFEKPEIMAAAFVVRNT